MIKHSYYWHWRRKCTQEKKRRLRQGWHFNHPYMTDTFHLLRWAKEIPDAVEIISTPQVAVDTQVAEVHQSIFQRARALVARLFRSY